MKLWHRRFAALLLGCCMQFTFSPYDQTWLAILAFAGLVWLIRDADSFKIGFAFGFGWFGVGSWWLADTIHVYGHVAYPVGLGVVALVGLVLAIFIALWSWLSWKIAGPSAWILIVFPLLGVCIEYLRGHLFTGLPWTAIGNLLLDTPAVGWASVTGVYGAALLPLCLASSIALLSVSRYRHWAVSGVVTVLLLGWLAPLPVLANGEERRVALVQANIPQGQKWDSDFLQETMRRYTDLSAAVAPRVDLIIWPEAAVPMLLEKMPNWDRWLSSKIDSWDTAVLFGGLKFLGKAETGQTIAQVGLFLSEPSQAQRTFVGKHHLVPFGEYVPSWIPFIQKLVPNIAIFRPAEDTGVLTLGEQTFGSLICYESIFPEEARHRVSQGANVITLVTNDAWYDQSPAAWQHLQAARMRAVENGRYVLRAANTGISAIIAPDGTIEKTVPWWTQAVVEGTYRTSDAITPYQRWGDWPLAVLPVLLLLIYIKKRIQ
ncbi:MAG: apolipoprotein N-acyltransferase [Mariprofundaceae bacterium]